MCTFLDKNSAIQKAFVVVCSYLLLQHLIFLGSQIVALHRNRTIYSLFYYLKISNTTVELMTEHSSACTCKWRLISEAEEGCYLSKMTHVATNTWVHSMGLTACGCPSNMILSLSISNRGAQEFCRGMQRTEIFFFFTYILLTAH